MLCEAKRLASVLCAMIIHLWAMLMDAKLGCWCCSDSELFELSLGE